jgi:hypothetical protein
MYFGDVVVNYICCIAAGPLALPLIGSVLQVALADPNRPYVAFQKLAKKYGNIMSLQLGSVSAGLHNISQFYLTWPSLHFLFCFSKLYNHFIALIKNMYIAYSNLTLRGMGN